MFKTFANKGSKKKNKNTDATANETASINSAASGSSQTVITPTILRRSATMEPNKSRGLVMSYNPPDPVVSTTAGPSDNAAIISQVPPPQQHNHNEAITKIVKSSTGNQTVTSTTTTTTSQSAEVVENRTFKIQPLSTKVKFRPKVPPKPEVTHINLEYYLENIANERLRRMPGRGSTWDRVLHAAQFFGLQMSDFGDKINIFVNAETPNTLAHEVRDDHLAREGSGEDVSSNGQKNNVFVGGTVDVITTALTAAHSLLEIGYTQADTLLPTFSVLYEISAFFTDIIRVYSLEQPSQVILDAAIHTFHNLIVFINGMRTLCQQKIRNLKPGSSESPESASDFRTKVEQIWRFKQTLSNEIWKHELEAAGVSMDIDLLRSKLRVNESQYIPNGVFENIDHYANISTEVGYWLKNILSDDNSGQILCITGGESSGKTFLAGWIEERLARPMNVKSNHVLRYNFPYDLPSEPAPKAFLKDILYNILDENVSNIDVFKSIVQAFGHQFAEADSEPTELLLWEALHDSLKAIRIKNASIVILLDGCEGIAGGDAEFYKKLRNCISGLSNVRVVTFSRSVPENVREYEYVIPKLKIEKDIQTYFSEILYRSYVFNNLSSEDRKALLETIVAKANANWLWSFYATQFLTEEQSKASLLKSIHDMESDILLKVITTLEFDKHQSLRNLSLRTLLSIMLVVTRPFTIADVNRKGK